MAILVILAGCTGTLLQAVAILVLMQEDFDTQLLDEEEDEIPDNAESNDQNKLIKLYVFFLFIRNQSLHNLQEA